MSSLSGIYLGRPWAWWQNAADHGPLISISASPPDSARSPRLGNRLTFDSIIDNEQRSSPGEDSLFEKTNYRSSKSSDSVFGDDYSQPLQGGLLPLNHFRPLSVASIHSPLKDDDTMISVSFFFFVFLFDLKFTKFYITNARRTCLSSFHSASHRCITVFPCREA